MIAGFLTLEISSLDNHLLNTSNVDVPDAYNFPRVGELGLGERHPLTARKQITTGAFRVLRE
jgi:hypothetical protein